MTYYVLSGMLSLYTTTTTCKGTLIANIMFRPISVFSNCLYYQMRFMRYLLKRLHCSNGWYLQGHGVGCRYYYRQRHCATAHRNSADNTATSESSVADAEWNQ